MFAIITGYTSAKCVTSRVAKPLTITITAVLSTIAVLIVLGQLLSLVPDL